MSEHNQPTTLPPALAALLSSLAEELTPLADGHPYDDLAPLLRNLHSTLEMLNDYALGKLGVDPDPIDIRIADVIESAAGMAAEACEHLGRLESRLISNAKQLRSITGKCGEEV